MNEQVNLSSCRPASTPTPSRCCAAVDLGAESCRVSLATWNAAEGATMTTVHRFANHPAERDGHLHWDLNRIISGVEEGLRLCAERASGPIESIGVDCWAVDYVRLDETLSPLDDPFCYRDLRTEARMPELWKKLPAERIYAITGIQLLRFNTLYQLYADRCDGVDPGRLWLNIPEYVLFHLGGRPAAEYNNVTHTQMVEAGTRKWSEEIFHAAGIDSATMPEIVPPGSDLGTLHGPLAELPNLRHTRLIAPACHDTGAAVAGIPYEGDEWGFLSSGTWSLVGAVLPKNCVTDEARLANFSNEGGLGGSSRFLKNVNGMWILQECMRQWAEQGRDWPITSLIDAAASLPEPKTLLSVDDPELLMPGEMLGRINRVLAAACAGPVPESPDAAPEVANLIFHSLASRYAYVLKTLTNVTGKRLKRLYVVGGGSRNDYLNALVAGRTGLEVCRGPVESSTVGNVAIQFAVLDGATEPEWGVLPDAVSAWSKKLAHAADAQSKSAAR